jgi:hypothetical protein
VDWVKDMREDPFLWSEGGDEYEEKHAHLHKEIGACGLPKGSQGLCGGQRRISFGFGKSDQLQFSVG